MSDDDYKDDPEDYDDGDEESLRSKDWDMEPGDPGWIGDLY